MHFILAWMGVDSARDVAAETVAVSKLFGSFAALRQVTCSFARGGLHVILGENGAGKSTLIRMLAGLSTPTAGSVRALAVEGVAARGVAYMSHASMLYEEMTAMENLNYFAGLYREPNSCGCNISPEMALRAVGLDPHLTRPVGQYSQGMRQRTSLARVLQTDPELLLLDEPFSNLDVASAGHMVELLADFRTWPVAPVNGVAGARTIILTTHQAHLAEAIADTVLTMQQGQVISTVSREATAG